MVSICIPTYNNLKLFRQCLDSVLTQDYKNFEIIVSDDSTNTEIGTYIEDLGLANLIYSRNTPSLGMPANWNKAIRMASGKYIKILHHDDHFTKPDSLKKFVASLENNPKASFSFCFSTIHFKKDDELFIHKQTRTQIGRLEKDPRFLFFRNVIGAPSATFFRNDIALRFNEEYRWLVDVEFYIRYLKIHGDFVSIPEPLITVADGEPGQVTREVADNRNLVISEHLRLFGSLYNAEGDPNAILFFQELFVRFEILTFEQLKSDFSVPDKLNEFFSRVFADLSRNKFWKTIKKRILTSRYNKQIFKMERF